jgi:SAM-dependent methyltransferase
VIQWRFTADTSAMQTVVGVKTGGVIEVRANSGFALHGPYMEMPAGRCVVRVRLIGANRGTVRIDVTAGRRTFADARLKLTGGNGQTLEIRADIPEAVPNLEVRLKCLGPVSAQIAALEIDLERTEVAPLTADRQVGYESRKSYAEKIENGFFDRYLSGPNVIEVGFRGYEEGNVTIVPQAIGVDVGYPGYDGVRLPFADGSVDAIYSSHCFEHIADWLTVLRDWWRLLKVGGYLVIVVPHRDLFERKFAPPSPINPDHKRFYTSKRLLDEIETAFPIPNTWRIRSLIENDRGFDYDIMPYVGTLGAYEIELVIQKLERPFWNLDKGSVRAYPAGDFRTELPKTGPWELELDLSRRNHCIVFGPYIGLDIADYEADFYFDWDGPIPDMVVDVAHFAERIASARPTRAEHRDGKVTVPFHNPEDGGIFEFRIYAGGKASRSRPRFKGVVVRYAGPKRA